jgi:hypothetical protein
MVWEYQQGRGVSIVREKFSDQRFEMEVQEMFSPQWAFNTTQHII